MGATKAPGNDGYLALFYQASQDKMGNSFYDFMKGVSDGTVEIERVYQTLLSLVRKQDHSEFVNQFRPISLCNVIYKNITKVIVNKSLVLFLEDSYKITL